MKPTHYTAQLIFHHDHPRRLFPHEKYGLSGGWRAAAVAAVAVIDSFEGTPPNGPFHVRVFKETKEGYPIIERYDDGSESYERRYEVRRSGDRLVCSHSYWCTHQYAEEDLEKSYQNKHLGDADETV